ncbi:multidrug effflux MFS transporter [Corynebacterium sp. 320]|uniref:multidrug effflux MFS transporter n=1 Tax=Corynebacterium TaxID=1716 RepID=UPI00125CD236|nr:MULTISPECIES: multidrug effflux MFS transporter [Corynebacterium]KAB1503083.1 multidrug effflux MFS transporter [Corynebacterium sp. 320]KAB1551065.1 multidrug effflux MFS transporter [Corynebacterium sp. 319]KAB3526880.1 multidrug effflux MFS transporter [Corynebacterium sp. 250]KAB3538373.1 multidrug effflux MFS transporter [Corynebacterium sp. 366]QNP92505.1 multidrug effflux MFS transporter [Corynebacterium zhongnanshanii]
MLKPAPGAGGEPGAGGASARLSLMPFVGLALIFAAGPLGTDMFLPSVPAITAELHTAATTTQLAITTFMIGMGVGQVLFGPVSDSWGRRQLLISGTLLGVLSSLVCSLAPSIEILVTARLFQGIAGGIGVVLVRAIITDRSKPSEAAKSFAVLMAINGVAPIVAPLIGGVLHEVTGWRGVFWVLTAVAVVQLGVAVRNPESLDASARSEGRVLSTYRRMGTLLKIPEFAGHVLIFGFGFGTMFAFIAGSSVVFQSQLGLSPVAYSVAFAVNASALIVMSVVNVRLAGVVDPRTLQKWGVVLLALGAVALLVVAVFVVPHVPGAAGAAAEGAEAAAPLWLVVVCLLCTITTTAGNGLMMANTTVLAQGIAARYAGAGSALLGAVQFLVAGLVSPMTAMGEDKLMMLALTMCASAVVAHCGNALVVFGRRRAA